MPLGDESFYTLDGQEINRAVLVQHMIDYYNAKYENTQITDFNEGSEIRNIMESLACDIFHLELNDQQILQVCFLATSYGQYLDLFGEELHTPRIQASQSWGTVTFTIPEATTQTITIPQYTQLMSSTTGLIYQTNMTVEIPIGDTSVDCPVFSLVPGAGTNAEAETITLFNDTKPYEALTVNNANAFTGGTDTETDDDYRARLLYVKSQDSFGSKDHYIRLGESVAGVHDVLLVDGSAGYTGKVLVNGVVKPLASSILAEVAEVFTFEPNLVYNQSFEVAEVGYTTVPLEISVGVTDEVSSQLFTDLLTILFNGGTATIAGVDYGYLGLKINGAITNYTLLSVLESLPFVVQVTSLTSNNSTFTKLEPGTNKVLKLGTISVVQTVVE